MATLWWLASTALAVILLAPLTLTEIPPPLDYPNHLARMQILAHGGNDPALSHTYRAEWSILPNIGIDLVMPALMRLLPLALTGKIFLGLGQDRRDRAGLVQSRRGTGRFPESDRANRARRPRSGRAGGTQCGPRCDGQPARSMRDNDSTMHLAALLVIERKAFWPLLFAAPTKQPVKVLPPMMSSPYPRANCPGSAVWPTPSPTTSDGRPT